MLLVTLGVLLAAGLAVGGYLLLTRTELFVVRAVEVGGITGAQADAVRAAVEAGLVDVGENRVQ